MLHKLWQSVINRPSSELSANRIVLGGSSVEPLLDTTPPLVSAEDSLDLLKSILDLEQQTAAPEDVSAAIAALIESAQAFGRGDYGSAVLAVNRAVELEPENAHIWYGRGDLLAQFHCYDEAIASYNQAIRLNPNFYQAWNHQSQVLLKIGRSEQARYFCEQALVLQPDDSKVWLTRSSILSAMGHFLDAIASGNQAIALMPVDTNNWLQRGLIWLQQGQALSAIANMDRALCLHPTLAEIWMARGQALEVLEQWDMALANYDRAIVGNLYHTAAWTSRGRMLARLGQLEAAIASFDHALAICSELPETWLQRGQVALQALDQATLKEPFAQHFVSSVETKTESLTRLLKMPDIMPFIQDFRESFHQTNRQLIQTMAAHPQVQQVLKATTVDGTIRALRQLRTYRLIKFLEQSIQPSLGKWFQTIAPKLPAQQYPQLNQRGTAGALASYEVGMQLCPQDSHAAQWEQLWTARQVLLNSPV